MSEHEWAPRPQDPAQNQPQDAPQVPPQNQPQGSPQNRPQVPPQYQQSGQQPAARWNQQPPRVPPQHPQPQPQQYSQPQSQYPQPQPGQQLSASWNAQPPAQPGVPPYFQPYAQPYAQSAPLPRLQPVPAPGFAFPPQVPFAAAPVRRRLPRRRVLGIGVVAAALVAGLCVWLVGSPSAPVRERAPFYGAVIALAETPAISYQTSIEGGAISMKASVTSQDEVNGTLTVDGDKFGLLVANGTTYVQPPASILDADLAEDGGDPAAGILNGSWITGGTAGDEIAGADQGLETPSDLAQSLLAALNDPSTKWPVTGDAPATVGGVAALTAQTPVGAVSVALDYPYRVLSIDSNAADASASPPTGLPSGLSSMPVIPSAALRLIGDTPAIVADFAPGRRSASAHVMAADYGPSSSGYAVIAAAAGVADTPTLGDATLGEAYTQADLDDIYSGVDNLLKQAAENTIDPSIKATQQGNLQISCSDGGCEETATVTESDESTSPDSQVEGGQVELTMDATATVNGVPAGGCTGSATAAANGTATISCDDGAAAPVFEAQDAEAKEQAQQESEAEDGAPVQYEVPYEGEAFVTGVAMLQVAQLVQDVQQSQQDQQEADDEPDPYAVAAPSVDEPTTQGSEAQQPTAQQPTGQPTAQQSAEPANGENPGQNPGGAPSAVRRPATQADAAISMNPYEPVPFAPYAGAPTIRLPAGAATSGSAPIAGSAPTSAPTAAGPQQQHSNAASTLPSPTQEPQNCLDMRPGDAYSAPGGGWITNSAASNGRAETGVACLTDATGPTTNPSVDPVGWAAAQSTVTSLGLTNFPIARCHVIASTLGGSNNSAANLVPCWQQPVNGSQMRTVEIAVGRFSYKAVVRYTVSPLYQKSTSTVPDAIMMQAYAIYPSGDLEWIESVTYPNVMKVNGKNVNLGN